MLDSLQKRWKVNGKQALLILCVFAITGTLTAYVSKVITQWAGFDTNTFWLWKLLLRLLVLIFGYQFILLITAALFGQFSFFWKYEKKILQRFGLMKKKLPVMIKKHPAAKEQQPQTNQLPKKRMAIFASGAGSNAQQIIRYFKNSFLAEAALVVCNKPGAGVLQIASAENVPVLLVERDRFFNGDAFLPELKKEKIDFIILAGFLWKIPGALIEAYPRRIINIHPALLPGFGGKGMYGQRVHEAVIKSGEKKSGITIHYVDEHYDNGDIIFQKECVVEKEDSAGLLAARIHQLEHAYYPKVIEEELRKLQLT
jgi:formyltetrahydrofolate-dependent phosphoribosylglycinamide formyltransferase